MGMFSPFSLCNTSTNWETISFFDLEQQIEKRPHFSICTYGTLPGLVTSAVQHFAPLHKSLGHAHLTALTGSTSNSDKNGFFNTSVLKAIWLGLAVFLEHDFIPNKTKLNTNTLLTTKK